MILARLLQIGYVLCGIAASACAAFGVVALLGAGLLGETLGSLAAIVTALVFITHPWAKAWRNPGRRRVPPIGPIIGE